MSDTGDNSPASELARLRRSSAAMSTWQRAMQCLNTGRNAPALDAYRSLLQEFPHIPQLWLEMGVAAAGDLDFAQADQSFQRALELAPADANLLGAVGAQYYQLRRLDQAFACMQRAVAADPASANARLALATWLERSRRLDEAWECVETWLAREPKNGQARYFKAFLLHRKGLKAEAETALRDLLQGDPLLALETQANAWYLLGAVLDDLGQYDQALDALGRAKVIRCQTTNIAAFEKQMDQADRQRREALAALTPDMLRRWRDEAAPDASPLVFLGGAPRSGTTLFEQILGAHPQVLVFDEVQAFLKEILGPLHALTPGRGLPLQTLQSLGPAQLAQFAARYIKSLVRETSEDPGRRILLDKNPSTTAWLHVWLRVFPRSKIMIALRDPRDVIISSYFQNMTPAWATVNFRTLEKTVRLYAACMDVWLRLRELGGFDWIETRYEDIVANLEAEGRKITNFAGLEWDPGQAAYYETARRKFVHAPTYNEVTKPVYTRAVRRWEHYAAALAPLAGNLEPYLRAFRYN